MNSINKTESHVNPLAPALRSLNPTGIFGFEGLIKELLEDLTGRQYFLARSGDQEGRDIASDHRSNSVIAVECKRYGRSTGFKERELSGELIQASEEISYLDLWVLVTSRSIDSKLYERLDRRAQSFGFEFYAISTEDNSSGNLDVLCAHSQRVLEGYLGSTEGWEDIKKWLAYIRADEQYSSKINGIQSDLLPEVMGYENWRRGNNSWFISCLRTEKESITYYKQKLNVNDSETRFIPRKEASDELDSWLHQWKQTQLPLVLLGEEGDGKTWVVAEWLTRKVKTDTAFPPVLFLNSQQVSLDDPITLMSKVVANRQMKRTENYWRERIHRWLSREHSEYPVLILVLDGINERGASPFWRGLLNALTLPLFKNKIALLVTSRTGYWREYFSPIRDLEYKKWILSPYNDEEIANALSNVGLSRNDIASNLEPLIRKPRYFDLMVRFREEMAQSGDVTVARLIYEDWHDRYQRKTHTPLTNAEFQNLLRDLAKNHINSTTDLRDSDISPLIPLSSSKRESLQELSTGGVLEGEGGRYKVNGRMLSLGFGLLLADQVEREIVEGRHDQLYEFVQVWLDPRELDIKAEICEAAAYHAMVLSSYPQYGRNVLLRSWLEIQNPGPGLAEHFPAYFPIDPKTYIRLAEEIWSGVSENQWGQNLIMYTLLRWRNLDWIESLLADTFERWLGYVHPAGFPHQRGMKNEKEDEVREKVRQRVGSDLSTGMFQFASHDLTIVEDDGLLRLGRMALAVISHMRREPYIRAIANGCLAEALMDYPEKYDLSAWVIRSASEPLESAVIDKAKQLMQENDIASYQAAHRLLSFIGTTEAKDLQIQLPTHLFENTLRKLSGDNPCYYTTPWPVDICQECLETSKLESRILANNLRKCSLNPMFSIPKSTVEEFEIFAQSLAPENIWVAMMNTSEDHTIDFSEPSFCAHIPNSYADFLRSVVNTADKREAMPLRQLSIRLREISSILGNNEYDLLYKTWKKTVETGDLFNDTIRFTENQLFDYILGELDSHEQVASLLNRPIDVDDLLVYEHNFRQPESWDVLEELLNSEEDAKRLHRILWYIATFAQTVPDHVIRVLSKFLGHEDSFVRSLVLKTIHISKSAELSRSIIDDGWSWNANHHPDENHWGSLIVSEYGDKLSYPEIRNIVHPTFLTYAVLARCSKSDEIDQYSDDIDRIWRIIAEEGPDLPEDFPRAEANYRIGDSGQSHLLCQVETIS